MRASQMIEKLAELMRYLNDDPQVEVGFHTRLPIASISPEENNAKVTKKVIIISPQM